MIVVYYVLARYMNTTFWSDGMKWYVLLYARATLATSCASADGCCVRMQKILELVHGGSFFFGGNFLGRRQTWGGRDGWWRHCREGKGRWKWRFVARFFGLLKIGKVSQLFQEVEGLGSASMLCNRWPVAVGLKWRWLGVWYILLIHAGDTKVDGTAYMTVPLLMMVWRTCPRYEVKRLVWWLPKERNWCPCFRATEYGVVWGVS